MTLRWRAHPPYNLEPGVLPKGTRYEFEELMAGCFSALNSIVAATQSTTKVITPETAEALRGDLRVQVDAMMRRAAVTGVPREDTLEMMFAVMHTADDLLRRGGGGGAEVAMLLLHPARGPVPAGPHARFSAILREGWEASRPEVLRVYLRCLELGYRESIHGPDRDAELAELVERAKRALAEPPRRTEGRRAGGDRGARSFVRRVLAACSRIVAPFRAK